MLFLFGNEGKENARNKKENSDASAKTTNWIFIDTQVNNVG
jgi:hypothetical protein